MERHQIRPKDYNNLWIRSKVRFQWNFQETLDEIISAVEHSISKDIMPNYEVEYTQFWDQFIKLKVKDDNLMIDRLIVCNINYSKNDEIYWYIVPKFTSAEKSQKTKKYELPKFVITDNEQIIKAITEKLKEIIEEF